MSNSTTHTSEKKGITKITEVKESIAKGVPFTEKEIMMKADEVAEELAAKGLEKNKIREYFGQVKGIATELRAGKDMKHVMVELWKMKAKAAYDSKRTGLKGVDALKPLIDAFVKRVEEHNDAETFKRDVQGFCDFFECVIGYHYFCK